MNDPAKDPSTLDAELARLRDRLGLYEQVPVIEEVHALMGTPEIVLICVHDSANGISHSVPVPFEPGKMGEVVTDEAEVTPEAQVRLALHLAAAYN